ncbi:N-acetylmuramoyl-L-alanine amidase [Bacillus cereus]|uniref:N-acetylmuramoyl-L-alanine amidase n=1 Tax=Bacillus cereus TaxID=1396 RepID=UPI00211103C9|nr:N-acetylmuramoyl-L-alanine amidase [Bacillus cereus]
MKYNPAYIRFEKSKMVNEMNWIGKRVVAKVDNLRFYDSPSWQDEDVAGTLDAGEGFTIDEKVSVNGSPQFKVHNSNGHTYYITAGNSYIHV